MMIKKIEALIVAFILLIIVASCSVSYDNNVPKVDTAPLKITFINVGQGDTILVQCGSSNMLIDAGTNEAGTEVLEQLKKNNVDKIDILVGTHPHEDHIGSMDKVINNYEIGQIYMPKITATTKTFKDVVTAIKNKGMSVTTPVTGTSFKLGEAECTILAPNSKSYEELNNYSIVIKLVFGNTSYLFTGDAEGVSEQEMLEKGFDLSADVLKLGHHGSSSSTTKKFLEAVNPKYAVIMCGKDNDYKHPQKSTMNKIKKTGIPVYRTDENGTIVCTSDGTSINFDVEPGSYKSGSNKN